jgi:hypothetical protein
MAEPVSGSSRLGVVNRDTLRAALEQRIADWKAELRKDAALARLALRQLIGPMTLWAASVDTVYFDVSPAGAIVQGIVPTQLMASPTETNYDVDRQSEGFQAARRLASAVVHLG